MLLPHAAVITLVRTACDVRVFSLDHLSPTETRMVVTAADPETRTVFEINAEPAAREYARILGKDPMQLTPLTFASHPVLVRLGGQYHVRSIQLMDERGNLVFFSAIDEGLVLTAGRAQRHRRPSRQRAFGAGTGRDAGCYPRLRLRAPPARGRGEAAQPCDLRHLFAPSRGRFQFLRRTVQLDAM